MEWNEIKYKKHFAFQNPRQKPTEVFSLLGKVLIAWTNERLWWLDDVKCKKPIGHPSFCKNEAGSESGIAA